MLVAHVPEMRDEYRDALHYEGRYGPSAREMRAVLMDCRYDAESPCISPVSLFRQLRRLVKDKTLYEFLRVEPEAGYHDVEGLIEVVTGVYADLVAEELLDSMQLVEPDQWRRVFARYVQHVNALRSREMVRDTFSGKVDPPDEKFIEETEAVIARGATPTQFRETLIGRVGAWRVDHPDERPDYSKLFPEAVEALQEDYYRRNRRLVDDVQNNLLRYGTDDMPDLEPELRKRVTGTMDTMLSKYGYCPACAKEAISFLAKQQARPG